MEVNKIVLSLLNFQSLLFVIVSVSSSTILYKNYLNLLQYYGGGMQDTSLLRKVLLKAYSKVFLISNTVKISIMLRI